MPGPSPMKGQLFALRERLSQSLWFIPSLALLAAVAGSELTTALDEQLDSKGQSRFVFSGSPEAARSLLSTISSSMITFTGVVFSITMLVLQLASSQLSPRVMRTFLRDRGTQIVLAVFIGSFTYSLLVLRKVGPAAGAEADGVRSISVWTAVVLLFVSILCFVYFIHHIAQSIRAIDILRRVGDETRAAIEDAFPAEQGPPAPITVPGGPPARTIRMDDRSGVLVHATTNELAELAANNDCVIELLPRIGNFVPRLGVVAHVWGASESPAHEEVLANLRFSTERTMAQDPGFGFRQLVDIAARALSPGVNDPTTAVQALDQLHDLLAMLSARDTPEQTTIERDGVTRLIVHQPDWDHFVALALDEIRQYGQGSVQVMRRLRFLVEDLLANAPPHRARALQRQLGLLDEAVMQGFQSEGDRERAREPAPQG